jgi:hypothetical protein
MGRSVDNTVDHGGNPLKSSADLTQRSDIGPQVVISHAEPEPERTRFEMVAERKLRRRHLTETGDVEITGRDLREKTPPSVSRCHKPAPVNSCGRPYVFLDSMPW